MSHTPPHPPTKKKKKKSPNTNFWNFETLTATPSLHSQTRPLPISWTLVVGFWTLDSASLMESNVFHSQLDALYLLWEGVSLCLPLLAMVFLSCGVSSTLFVVPCQSPEHWTLALMLHNFSHSLPFTAFYFLSPSFQSSREIKRKQPHLCQNIVTK